MRTAIAAGGNRDAALLGAGELVSISMELLSAQGWCFCRSTADRTSSFPTLILRVTKLNNTVCQEDSIALRGPDPDHACCPRFRLSSLCMKLNIRHWNNNHCKTLHSSGFCGCHDVGEGEQAQ